ncbi:MAG: hypothetical protein ACLQPD_26050 [Desulfomonilaceae bacterium]
MSSTPTRVLSQGGEAENELTKARSGYDKAIDKVKQAHSKLKEELKVYKRLMEREA